MAIPIQKSSKPRGTRSPTRYSNKRNLVSDIKCMYPRKVDSDMINLLPTTSYKGEFILVETDEVLDVVLPEIAEETILGFDTETRPNFTKNKHYPVSILQLGGRNKVWIIRLEPLKHRLDDIYEILENPAIKKVGIAVNGDIVSLKERRDFIPAGFEDIARYTRGIGVINTGMKNLAALVLGEKISKSAQLTNWASDSLTEKQLEYAATDAWISRRLYIAIKHCVETTNIGLADDEVETHFSLKSFVSKIIKKFSFKIHSSDKPQKREQIRSRNDVSGEKKPRARRRTNRNRQRSES